MRVTTGATVWLELGGRWCTHGLLLQLSYENTDLRGWLVLLPFDQLTSRGIESSSARLEVFRLAACTKLHISQPFSTSAWTRIHMLRPVTGQTLSPGRRTKPAQSLISANKWQVDDNMMNHKHRSVRSATTLNGMHFDCSFKRFACTGTPSSFNVATVEGTCARLGRSPFATSNIAPMLIML